MKLKPLMLLVLTLWTGEIDAASNGQNSPTLLPGISGSRYILEQQIEKLQKKITRLEKEQTALRRELNTLQNPPSPQVIPDENDGDEDNSDDDNDPYLTRAKNINDFDSDTDTDRESTSSMGSTSGATPTSYVPLQGTTEKGDDVFEDDSQKLNTSSILPVPRRVSVRKRIKQFEKGQPNSANRHNGNKPDNDDADDDEDDN